MAIHEFGVPDDFFQCGDTGEYCFPCCACTHKKNDADSLPCKFCGHNVTAEEHYTCCLCGEVQPGDPYDDGKHIARDTPAGIGPICLTCYNTLGSEFKSR